FRQLRGRGAARLSDQGRDRALRRSRARGCAIPRRARRVAAGRDPLRSAHVRDHRAGACTVEPRAQRRCRGHGCRTRARGVASCDRLKGRACVAERADSAVAIDAHETESLAGQALSDEPDIGRDHRRDHRVAPCRLMLSEQDDRSAARRNLNRSGDNTTREDLPLARADRRPAEPCAHAVACGFDLEIRAEEQGMGLIRETLRVRTRDGAYLSGVVMGTEGGKARPVRVYAGCPERKSLAGAPWAADSGRQIRRPASEDRFGRYPTGHREVGESGALAADHGERLAGTGESRGPPRHDTPAPQRHIASGNGDDAWAVAAEREGSTDDLDRGGTGLIADKGLRGGERERIGGAGRRHALAKVIEAAAILDGRAQSGRVDVHHRATNRTRSPGRISGGGSLALSKTRTSVRPINRQPPGESKGYIDVCPSAIATDPAGTRSRGRS